MAKAQLGIKERTQQTTVIGTVDFENMTIEADGNYTIQEVFEKYDGKLVKIVFEEVPQE